jgi:ParB-like chromosome segregation protein Spo0J
VGQRGNHTPRPVKRANNAARCDTDVSERNIQARDTSRATAVSVPVLALRSADSPRLDGEDKSHIARLAETEAPLPPILVDRKTMRVIDGMHRLMAASLLGKEKIDVIFFEGNEDDIFLHAVQENVTHGLPLSQADRRSAAERIIVSHPHMSDRTIGHVVGLAAKTVGGIRKRSAEDAPQSSARVGRDGKVRPLNSEEGRRRAAELLTKQPEATLRDVARASGISPATVLDVRKRLERGEPAVPEKQRPVGGGTASDAGADADGGESTENQTPVTRLGSPKVGAKAPTDPASAVEKLLRDPSLRSNERGKGMLRVLHVNAVADEQLRDIAISVPPHCVSLVAQLAHQYAEMWQEFASELDQRARIIDPSAAAR